MYARIAWRQWCSVVVLLNFLFLLFFFWLSGLRRLCLIFSNGVHQMQSGSLSRCAVRQDQPRPRTVNTSTGMTTGHPWTGRESIAGHP